MKEPTKQEALAARRARFIAEQNTQIADRIEHGHALPSDYLMLERTLLSMSGGSKDRVERVWLITALRQGLVMRDVALLEQRDQLELDPAQAERLVQLDLCAEQMLRLEHPTTIEQLAMHEAVAFKAGLEHRRSSEDAGMLAELVMALPSDEHCVALARAALEQLFPELSEKLTDVDMLEGLRAYDRSGGGARHEDVGKWAKLAELVRKAGLSSIGPDELRRDYVQWSLYGGFSCPKN